MFERLKNWVKGGLQKMAAGTGLAREFKDIFEIGGVPAFNQFYYFGIFVWKYLYRGFYNVWHLVPAPTIQDPQHKRQMYRMDMAKAISAEMASLIWSEACTVNVSTEGLKPSEQEQDDPLGRFVASVLRENNFTGKMQELVEQAMALGGGTLKTWYTPDRDAEGRDTGTGRICIGYGMADQFVPTAWNNAEVTEGVFVSRQAKDGWYYTRLEWHKWNGDTYTIENQLFRSEMRKGGATESQDILGYEYPLNAIYPTLNGYTEIKGIDKSLFSYFRTAIANNLDDNSPLGVSIYANAMSTLHALDICYDSLVSEFRLGKKRIIVPARAIRTVIDPNTGAPVRYFDATDEVYEALATDDQESLHIQDNSVELRVEEHVRALNVLLSVLCLQTGLSASTFTFDLASGLKTATEVVSENSKTYKTVKTNQTQVGIAVERLVHNIIALAVLYNVTFEGVPVERLAAGGYNVNVHFDDSIVQDRQTNINEGIMLVNNGLQSKFTFLTETMGLTPEQAQAEISRIKLEGRVGPEVFDQLDAFGA